jgi:hypothetical protein
MQRITEYLRQEARRLQREAGQVEFDSPARREREAAAFVMRKAFHDVSRLVREIEREQGEQPKVIDRTVNSITVLIPLPEIKAGKRTKKR